MNFSPEKTAIFSDNCQILIFRRDFSLDFNNFAVGSIETQNLRLSLVQISRLRMKEMFLILNENQSLLSKINSQNMFENYLKK